MAITGIDTIEGKQIIAAGAVSAKSAEMAYKDENGNDITATYLTGVDLTPYQTTAGMTAYLTTGDSAEFMTTAERSDYIPTGVSSEFYTTANTANYISEVPDTYLQNTDLATADGKVTAISGIPLSAGGDVPEGVMVESGLEYNAVNEISGYNGSAIAQYGAEKQFLQHDDTIVHVANSAQYAFGVNLSAVAQLLGIDETVLYSGTQTYSAILSESVKNFDKILIEYGPNNYSNIPAAIFFTDKFADNNAVGGGVHLEFIEHNGTNAYCFPKTTTFVWHNNFTNLDAVGGLQYRVSGNAIQNELTGNQLYIRKIIGIGRKQ